MLSSRRPKKASERATLPQADHFDFLFRKKTAPPLIGMAVAVAVTHVRARAGCWRLVSHCGHRTNRRIIMRGTGGSTSASWRRAPWLLRLVCALRPDTGSRGISSPFAGMRAASARLGGTLATCPAACMLAGCVHYTTLHYCTVQYKFVASVFCGFLFIRSCFGCTNTS